MTDCVMIVNSRAKVCMHHTRLLVAKIQANRKWLFDRDVLDTGIEVVFWTGGLLSFRDCFQPGYVLNVCNYSVTSTLKVFTFVSQAVYKQPILNV